MRFAIERSISAPDKMKICFHFTNDINTNGRKIWTIIAVEGGFIQ
jgi:hypothetical protein